MNPSSRPPESPLWLSNYSVLLMACVLLPAVCSGTPSITLSRTSGAPTTRILVSGQGFEPNIGVDIFFDTKDEALVVTNGQGEFTNAAIYAPRKARPGKHWISALQRNNDKGAQKPFLIQTNWSQFHFDAAGTRFNRYENVLDPKTVPSLRLKWSYNTGDWVKAAPAVVDGTVYVDSVGGLYALNARTGAVLWTYSGGYSSPAVADGVVYVGCFYSVCALNAATGALLWYYNTNGYVDSAPAVVDGVVYVSSDDGNMFALNAGTGAVIWSYAAKTNISSSPTVVNGVVYFGSGLGNTNMYAVNASTGALLWSFNAPFGVYSSPSVANGIVYFGAVYSVFALNATTGTQLWEYSIGSEIESSPAVANGIVYIGADDGKLYAFNANTGAKLWSYATSGNIQSAPAVADGVVYFGSGYPGDDSVYALNARTGALLWNYATGDYVYASPVVANGLLYVGSLDWNVYTFGLPDGTNRADPQRPDFQALRPNFNLKVSNAECCTAAQAHAPAIERSR
jgi:outer membrane protein assembly factor BamB